MLPFLECSCAQALRPKQEMEEERSALSESRDQHKKVTCHRSNRIGTTEMSGRLLTSDACGICIHLFRPRLWQKVLQRFLQKKLRKLKKGTDYLAAQEAAVAREKQRKHSATSVEHHGVPMLSLFARYGRFVYRFGSAHRTGQHPASRVPMGRT